MIVGSTEIRKASWPYVVLRFPIKAIFPPRTERDASNWSTDKLKTLLLAVRVENAEGACEVTEVSKLDGEASINNRKGKLIFFYEWNIKLAWTGESAVLLSSVIVKCVVIEAFLSYAV